MAKNSAKGMFDADNDRAAQVAKEDPLNEKDQQAAENKIMLDRMRRDLTSAPRS